MSTDSDNDTLDAHAFAAAHEAAPELDPERLRLAVDAYMDDLHIRVRRVIEARALTQAEAEAADVFAPREFEIDR